MQIEHVKSCFVLFNSVSTLLSIHTPLNMMMSEHLSSRVSWAFVFLILYTCLFLVLNPCKKSGYGCFPIGYLLVCTL